MKKPRETSATLEPSKNVKLTEFRLLMEQFKLLGLKNTEESRIPKHKNHERPVMFSLRALSENSKVVID